MSQPDSPVIVSDVTKSFRVSRKEKNTVLDGLDLEVRQGLIVGLLGVNGSGKTTLLKSLVGLLKPDAGELRVFGEDPWDISQETKRRIGYVPQQVRVAGWMSVAEVVRYTAAFYESQWDHAWAEKLIDRFGLKRDDRAGTLSGGQTQKLGLVLALGHRPELLLLDEPVAALDPIARRELLSTLVELVEETSNTAHQQTVLFSTHITADLERVATHVALLREGRVSLYDEMDSLKESIQRVRVTSSQPLPTELPQAETLHVATDTYTIRATLTDGRVDVWEQWADSIGADCVVDALNLEDLFIELHGVDARREDGTTARELEVAQ